MSSTEIIAKYLAKNRGFDVVLKKVNIIFAGDGNCIAEFKVEAEHINPMGILHGGFAMTVADVISTMALKTLLDDIQHVSVDITMSFIKSAKIGEEVVVNAKTIKHGKSLAYLDVVLKNKKTGEILVKGSQTQFILGKQKL